MEFGLWEAHKRCTNNSDFKWLTHRCAPALGPSYINLVTNRKAPWNLITWTQNMTDYSWGPDVSKMLGSCWSRPLRMRLFACFASVQLTVKSSRSACVLPLVPAARAPWGRCPPPDAEHQRCRFFTEDHWNPKYVSSFFSSLTGSSSLELYWE